MSRINVKAMVNDTCFTGTRANKGQNIHPDGGKTLYYHVLDNELHMGSKANYCGDIYEYKAKMFLEDDKLTLKDLQKAAKQLYKKTQGLTSDLVNEVRCERNNIFSKAIKIVTRK